MKESGINLFSKSDLYESVKTIEKQTKTTTNLS